MSVSQEAHANAKDYTGQRFGILAAVKRIDKKSKGSYWWLFQCECGAYKEMLVGNARSNKTGCGKHKTAAYERYMARGVDNNTPKRLHKHEYTSWRAMRERCNNKNHPMFKYYGGKGIKVCGRWDSFDNFYSDMGERPSGFSIDRVNSNGDYEPNNCRWSDKYTQARNTSGNVYVKVENVRYLLQDVMDKYNVPVSSFYKIKKLHRLSTQGALDYYLSHSQSGGHYIERGYYHAD